jgi:nucleotide-binding universal stress UspA family protein
MKFKKILVPTDFSEHSERALHAALEFARSYDAELLLLHVVEEPFDYQGYGLSPERILEIQQNLDTAVDAQLEAARRQCGDWQKVTLHRRQGAAFAEIIAMAKERAVDLIVIATHGHAGLAHLMLGSTTERVVRMAPCPVMTIAPPAGDS